VLARRAAKRLFYLIFALFGLVRRLRVGNRSQVSGVRNILLVRVDLMGDVLFSLPAAGGLKRQYPGARVTILTLPYAAPLTRLNPWIDEVVAVDTNRIRTLRGLIDPRTWLEYARAYRLLKSRRFDLAISLYGRMGSLCAYLSGARWTVGYAREAYPFLLSDPVEGGRHQERMHESEYVRRLIKHVGADMAPDGPALEIPVEAHSSANALLSASGISSDEQLVVIHAGSVNGSAKRWPAANWARFCGLVAERSPARIVLVGAESDLPITQEVVDKSHADIASLAGCTDLPTLAAVLSRADLVASGDSGPLHLAVALDRPVLAVYGPTDPAIYGPYRPTAPAIVHRADLPCSPCYTLASTAECPLADPICMRLVSVDQMVKSALALLEDPRS
jgi:lipopolysaccharide heptosyltransferase II